MPTGYTAPVQKGEQTFEEFVLSCARNFGALITMRDESMDAHIPDEFKPSDHHSKRLAEAREELARLRTLTPQQAAYDADADFRKAMQAWEEASQRRQEERERYEAMLAEVRAWTPPTVDHQGLKDFMIQQLEESIRFDCSGYERWKPEPKPGSVWLEERITKAERDVNYHLEEHAKEVERARERTAWVQALKRSLGGVAAS